MLDTNTVSYILNGRSAAARARLGALKDGEAICISSITEGELHYGVARAGASSRIAPALQEFLKQLDVLPWDSAAARAYGVLRAAQESAGRPLGNLDMLIAAHAIAAGATLVTHDAAFRMIRGLQSRVDWATDV